MKAASVTLLVTSVLTLAPDVFAQTEHTTDGEPSPLEEEIRWHMNRARFDTSAENESRGTSYTDVPAFAQPVAPHHAITLAARHHSEDMARNNAFQHDTIPGYTYYNPDTQDRFSDRMIAEGYTGSPAGENIAAGYGSAASAYTGWWNSGGHRRNMMGTHHREIGNGYFYFSDSTYRRYYTMDLGRSGAVYYFTGTLFHDANENGTYDQTEPVANVRIGLTVNGLDHPTFDISAAAGNFAIPIQTISAGSLVRVQVLNASPDSVQLSLPADYHSNTLVTLPPGERHVCGCFYQPESLRNIGFRDLTPLPRITLNRSNSRRDIQWPSAPGVEYQVQWTSDFEEWFNLGDVWLSGSGATLTQTDTASPPTGRFYRVILRLP